MSTAAARRHLAGRLKIEETRLDDVIKSHEEVLLKVYPRNTRMFIAYMSTHGVVAQTFDEIGAACSPPISGSRARELVKQVEWLLKELVEESRCGTNHAQKTLREFFNWPRGIQAGLSRLEAHKALECLLYSPWAADRGEGERENARVEQLLKDGELFVFGRMKYAPELKKIVHIKKMLATAGLELPP